MKFRGESLLFSLRRGLPAWARLVGFSPASTCIFSFNQTHTPNNQLHTSDNKVQAPKTQEQSSNTRNTLKKMKTPASLTFLDAKRNKPTTKEDYSFRNYSSELNTKTRTTHGIKLNPTPTHVSKQWGIRGKCLETLRVTYLKTKGFQLVQGESPLCPSRVLKSQQIEMEEELIFLKRWKVRVWELGRGWGPFHGLALGLDRKSVV